jgi:hypothetical protein
MSNLQPHTRAGRDFDDEGQDGLTSLIIGIEEEAFADERRRLLAHGARLVDAAPWITPRNLLDALRSAVLERNDA